MLTPEHIAEVRAIKNRLGRLYRDASRGNTSQTMSVISTDCALLDVAHKALEGFMLIQEQRLQEQKS